MDKSKWSRFSFLDFGSNLGDFPQLMLLRCWRVDRVYRAISDYVTKAMGEKYVMPPVVSFEVCLVISLSSFAFKFNSKVPSKRVGFMVILGDRFQLPYVPSLPCYKPTIHL